jgi:alkylation response protein AidB-like acyl-CoA dehydrogenase
MERWSDGAHAMAIEDRHRMVAAVKVQVDLSASHIGQDSVQLHGGIGVTMEYPVGQYTKRQAVIGKTRIAAHLRSGA